MNELLLTRYRIPLLAIGAWLAISSLQTAHFYFYFEQTLWNSVRWSFRDWFVWFAIFVLIYHLAGSRIQFGGAGFKSFAAVALIAVCSGFLQVLIIVSMDYLQGTATRPFWEDFWRFYNKRWFQYLFVFVAFWLLMSLHFVRNAKAGTEGGKIKVDDGRQTHWLNLSDIISIEAAGNYICIHLAAEQVIVRSTIKAFQAKLDDASFIRVSRSNLVNLSAVVSIKRVSKSKLELHLSNGLVVKVGPTYKEKVKTKLQMA